MTRPNPSLDALPHTFRASRIFTVGPGVCTLLLLILLAVLALRHQVEAMPLPGALAIASLALFITAVTLRITMDADGLTQRWAWGRRHIGWHQVASIERTRRGLFMLDEKGKEIFAVSALPLPNQQVITEAAIREGRLRRDKKKPKPPVLEKWVRK